MRCQVCAAPALPVGGACVFCHAPLPGGEASPGLLDYLAERLPGAAVKRSGMVGRGPVKQVTMAAAGEVFRARLRRGRLRLTTEMEAGAWVDRLLGRMTAQAAADGELRAAMSRAGWAHR